MPNSSTKSTKAIVQETIGELKDAGHTAVSIEWLEALLADVPEAPPLDRDAWRTWAPLQNANQLEGFKSALEAGQTALKTLVAINGAGVVALLTLMTDLLTKEPAPGVVFPIPQLGRAMFAFFLGVLGAGSALGTRYLVQLAAAQGAERRSRAMNWLAIGLGALSLVAFAFGGWHAQAALAP